MTDTPDSLPETTPDTTHAIILAAGRGSRLEPDEGHKLMVEIGGKPMIDRHLANFRVLGVTDVTVVCGWRHEVLEAQLEEVEVPDGMRLHTALNPGWEGSLGLSAVVGLDQARRNSAVDAPVPCWLTMSDHLYEPAIFEELAAEFEEDRPDEAEGMLAVDTEIDTIFDVPDATKLKMDEDGELLAIDKQLEDFQAADTGLFWCGEGFAEQMMTLQKEQGDGYTTAEAVVALAERGEMWFWDVGGARWQDVDTPEARAHAEQIKQVW